MLGPIRLNNEDFAQTPIKPINILITPPFDSPLPLTFLNIEKEIKPIMASHGINIVDDPETADWEIVGVRSASEPNPSRLPKDRVIVMDGEPPQPEFVLPHYLQSGYASIMVPANQKAYAEDCMAFYIPQRFGRREIKKINKIVQLATFRTGKGNSDDGKYLKITINGKDTFSYRVLCNLRVEVGMNIKSFLPEAIDIYGRGWPNNVNIVDNSRNFIDFLERRHQIAQNYGFDLCWENMEIPHYVSEKFWSPVIMGVLPLYWGPPEFHDMLPKESIIDCRQYLRDDGSYDYIQLVYDTINMSEEEYIRRVNTLYDWYFSLDRNSNRKSWIKIANLLAMEIKELHKNQEKVPAK